MGKIKLNELQRFIKNFFFKILSTVITMLINILTLKYLAGMLLPDGFGKYNFIITYTSYFIFLTSLGVDIVAIRIMSVNKSRIKEIYGSMAALKLILSAAVFVIMLTPMAFVPKLRDFGWVLVVFSITVLPVPFSVQSVFEATKRMEFPSLIAVAQNVINYVLIILLVKSSNDLLMVGIITVANNLFVFVAHNIIFLKQYGMWRFSVNISLWRNLLKTGVIIGFIQIVGTMIHYFSISMLGFMKSDFDVGIFSAAYRVMFMILSVIGIFHNLATPILFEYYKTNAEKYRFYFDHYLKLMIFIGYLAAACAIFLSEPLLGIFYNLTEYRGTELCFKIIMLSFFFMSINSPFAVGLIAIHREKTLLYIVLFQLAVNIACNAILIPRYGINGSAVTTVITEVIGVAFYIIVYKRYMPAAVMKKLVSATLSVIPVILFFHFFNFHFILMGMAATAIMTACAVVFKGYTIDELLHIKQNIFTFNK